MRTIFVLLFGRLSLALISPFDELGIGSMVSDSIASDMIADDLLTANIVPKAEARHFSYDPYLNGQHKKPSYGKGPAYRIPSNKRNKIPRLFGPFPLGFTPRDNLRRFPDNSLMLLSASFIIPFVPFGVFELRLPVGFFLNYIIDRLNGVNNGRSLEGDQADFDTLIEDLLGQTFALDGRKCVQRFICELSEEPVKDKSLMGEVLHTVMEPRKSKATPADDPYIEAELHGFRHGECRKKFAKCPIGISNLFY